MYRATGTEVKVRCYRLPFSGASFPLKLLAFVDLQLRTFSYTPYTPTEGIFAVHVHHEVRGQEHEEHDHHLDLNYRKVSRHRPTEQ